jgi:hypothetical protein
MVKLKSILNIDADTGANIIGAEATPVLTISNTSTGPGISVDELLVSSGATIDTLYGLSNLNVADLIVTSAATIHSNVTTAPALHLQSTMIQGATSATLNLGVASTASAPAIKLVGTAFVSCTSIDFTTAAVAGLGAIRVAQSDNDTLGWIPIMPDAAVDAVKWEA